MVYKTLKIQKIRGMAMYEDMFDDEFMTEEEIENAFDSLVSLMGEQIEKEEALPHIINPMVVQKVCYGNTA